MLEYAWDYYRERRVGPLYTNISRNTGVDRKALETIFPNGLVSIYTWVGIPILTTSSGCKPMTVIEVENPREVYLDHNATTPILPEVADALSDFFQDQRSFGNPSSSYVLASMAYDVVHRARKRVARCLAVEPAEIYFTGSGSEANNLAIKGTAARKGGGHIVTTNVEHASVLASLDYLESKGFSVTRLPVGRNGSLNPAQVADALRDDTILVSIMAANNEIGTMYPIAEIGAICRAREVPFHVDAIQAFGKIHLDPKKWGVGMLTMSGHKIGAPKGAGAIFVDHTTVSAEVRRDLCRQKPGARSPDSRRRARAWHAFRNRKRRRNHGHGTCRQAGPEGQDGGDRALPNAQELFPRPVGRNRT